MKTNRNIKKRIAAIVAVGALCLTALGTTYAYRDYKQHKSNVLKGVDTRYEARLVEDFVEIPDWKVGDGDIKKEIRVKNLGQALAGYGDLYVRLQLKEYMEIGEVTYVETEKRYMVGTDGQFIVRDSEADAKRDFPAHNVAQLTDKVTGKTGWFIETQAGDANGQMGKHVITDFTIGSAVPVIPASQRAVNINHHGVVTTDAQGKKTYATKSDECDYPVHPWNVTDPQTRQYIDAYIEWQLNMGAIVKLSAWDGKPVAKWILDDSDGNGWAYWGEPLKTDGGTTANLLNSVSLHTQPNGDFYYVIHTEMEAFSLDELIANKPDLGWNDKIREEFVKNAPSIKFNSTPGTSVKEGETLASPALTVGPNGAAQTPLTWTSSDPSLATVDQNGVVTGVKAGGPVTIGVKAPNGARTWYTIDVTPGTPVTVPATGVSINGGDKELAIGGTYTPGATVQPSNSTDTPVWSSDNSAVASVDPATGEITGNAVGTANITVTVNGKSDSIKVTVKAAALPSLPVKGAGPFEPEYDQTDVDKRYTMLVSIDSFDFDNGQIYREGSIKLSDILNTSDFSGLTVKAKDPSLNSYFTIKNDKDGRPSIVYTYYGTKAIWEAQTPVGNITPTPTIPLQLTLSKAGFADTDIHVTLGYEGSLYS